MVNKCDKVPKFGDVYLVAFDGDGSVQNGNRPAVVFQNNVGNTYSPNVTVLPITSKLKRTEMPTHVVLPSGSTGLRTDSMVLCENPVCIPKTRLGQFLVSLPDEYMGQIAEANMYASSAIAYVDPKALSSIRSRAVKLNA